MKKTQTYILLVFASIFIFFFYGKVLVNPNGYFFNNSGDGIKNYFTYAHHIKNDSSALEFEGMNYPYGEHYLYTDCHPVLANALQVLSKPFPQLTDYSIGILNFLMILSIFLTFFVSYFLLLEFGIGRWISLVFAIGMTLLAPQIFRLGGHYALSYSVAIPLSWLLTMRLLKPNKHLKYFILLLINNLFWVFIHAYLGVILLFFQFAILLLFSLSGNKMRTNFRKGFIALIPVLAPLLFYYFFSMLTDTHAGRTDNPSGFFLYNAEFDDLFIPHHPPLRPLLNELTNNAINLKWEAWAYVGFAGVVIFITLLISLIVGLFKRTAKEISKIYFNNKLLNISLLAAFVVLLFAFAFPFKQFPGLLDLLPFIKQFRATGRFDWPFYFAFMVFTASLLQTFIQRSPNKKWLLVLPALVLVLNVVEGLPYHQGVSAKITKFKNTFLYTQLCDALRNSIEDINPENYQAIITLPFYYYGSESFSRPRNDEAMRASMTFSYHTGLPNICANLTRTSIPESKKIVQLVSPAFYHKAIQADLPNQKPFLIIRVPTKLTQYENLLLDKATLIKDFTGLTLYELSYADLFKNTASRYFDEFQNRLPELHQRQGFLVSDTSSYLFYNDFENKKSDKPFRGMGGFESIKKGKNTFAEFKPETFDPGKTYHFSIWMYNGMKDALNLWFQFLIEEWNPETDSWHTTTFFPDQSEVVYGDWSLVEGTFTVQSSKNRVYMVSKGKDNSKARLFADDLLVKEIDTDIFRIAKDTLFYNNHHIINPH